MFQIIRKGIFALAGVGSRFLEVRRRSGETQVEFASKLGLSQSALVTYEKGERDPPVAAVIALCKAYDLSPAWLLLGVGSSERGFEVRAMKKAIDLSQIFILKFWNEPNQEDQIDLALRYFKYIIEHRQINDDISELIARRKAANE